MLLILSIFWPNLLPFSFLGTDVKHKVAIKVALASIVNFPIFNCFQSVNHRQNSPLRWMEASCRQALLAGHVPENYINKQFMIDLIRAHKPNHYFQTTQQTRGFRARSEITWFPVIINNWSSQQLSYHPQVWFHQHWLIIHPTIGNHFNNVKDNNGVAAIPIKPS